MNGYPMETGWQKMKRRCQEEPLVPLGCLATKFMRLRVIAQGATVVAMSLGGFIAIKPDEDKKGTKH
ncbi:hypothetical protein PC112_g9188 [Phytophthora cactorum]|nr:hypothetical protein PC112_g9188 [Phytophthora cactorum]